MGKPLLLPGPLVVSMELEANHRLREGVMGKPLGPPVLLVADL